MPMVRAMLRASVVIPVYERADLLAPCLDALVAAGLDGVEIVLVDNASSDPAMAPLLSAWESSARIVRNAANLGFATACNQGAEAAATPVVVFLNSDTEVWDGWIDPLLDALADPSVGMAGSRLLYPGGRVQHAGMALVPGGIPMHIHRGAPGSHPVATRSRDLLMVTAACCAMPRELFGELGGFDAEYRNGFEDVDLCMRVARAGRRVRYRGDSVVTHHESMSPGRLADDSANALRFRRRWHRWPSDWDAVLAEDGLDVRAGADCRWEGPLLDASSEAALGRRLLHALVEEGRRPAARESIPPAPLAADAVDACDDLVLAALNRLFLRVPAAESFLHLADGAALGAPRTAGPTVAVIGPGRAHVAGLADARAVVAIGPDALADADRAGVRTSRVATIDPDSPDLGAALGAVLGHRPAPRRGLGWWGPLQGCGGDASAGRGTLDAAFAAGLPMRAMSADAAPEGLLAPVPLLPAEDFHPDVWVVHHPPLLPDGRNVWDEVAIALAVPVIGAIGFGAQGLPPGWADACNASPEVWVPSAFAARSFADAGVDPERLHVVPHPVDTARLRPRGGERDRDAPVTFLSVLPWTRRAGWDVLLQAWAEEFAPDAPVRLVVLSHGLAAAGGNGPQEQAVAHLSTLGHDPGAIADVELRLHPVPYAEMPDLYRSADAFVLPSRGEGAGMAILEATACGLPVIATAWGGHEDLLGSDTAFPVAVAGTVEADEALVGDEPLYRGLTVAEPSIASLRARLREVADDAAAAAARAVGARALLVERHSLAAVGAVMSERATALLETPHGVGVRR